MIKLFLDNQSPVNATDIDGWTALHHGGLFLCPRNHSRGMPTDLLSAAISEGHGDAAISLLKAGADPKKEDRDGQLPLSLAPDAKIREFILTSAEREGIDLEP